MTISHLGVVLYRVDKAFAEYACTYTNAFFSTTPFTIGDVNAKQNITGDGIGIGIVVVITQLHLRVR
ncbi:MAG: hypothetical protein RML40_07880 [Bacteroidota bacterium]|nr:hypothetical protein [Candidatus Kapabacteria bacterium]MDW8220433.1 hypothetical protein [Bacteroidota bacterium]